MSEARGTWLAVEVVAACYEVDVGLLAAVCERGLVTARREGSTLTISVLQLDRVAWIVRLSRHHGLDLEAIELWLDELEAPRSAARRR